MKPKESIFPKNIEDEMKASYLDYAMSVIVGRALPDVRDGLKPVQRRILYTMYEMGLRHNQPFKKTARIVGDVLGKYHPHGDMAVYDALVRMVQDFSLRCPLIEGQGNFGSIDGDPPAAMRYTEARLKDVSDAMLEDIDKDTVNFSPNYDGSLKEPEVLPAKLPNLLVNGSSGIAVGMATNIPPHNLSEIVDAIIMLIDKPDADVDEIMSVLKGPDFPTGGVICGIDGIKEYFETGRGTIRLRGKIEVEDTKTAKKLLVIKELPYQVNKTQLLERIVSLIKEGKLEDISNIRDESDKSGMRVVIELKRDADSEVVMNQLYMHTQLEVNFGVIMLSIVNGEPKVLNIFDMINHYISHRKNIIYRRTKYDLHKKESRAHILEGFRVVIDNIDKVIKIIRTSETPQQASMRLIEGFGLSKEQADAILQLRLQQLTALEREKIQDEYLALIKEIEILKSILCDPKKILNIIKDELNELKQKYGDKRRTVIQEKYELRRPEDLIKEEEVVVTISSAGYIKRTPVDVFKTEERGKKAELGTAMKAEDAVSDILFTNTLSYLFLFTDKGRMHRIKTYEIPEGTRAAIGKHIANIVQLEQDEKVTAVLPVKDIQKNVSLIMVTKNGFIKKISLNDLITPRKSIMVVNLDKGDILIGVKQINLKDQVFLVTKKASALRFDESQVRPMGRAARGVMGIKLEKDDEVIGCEAIDSSKNLVLIVTENGYGKRVEIKDFRAQNRATKGMISGVINEKTGENAAIKKVEENDDVLIVTRNGKALRLKANSIPVYGRNTQGVRLLKLEEGDKVVSVTRVPCESERCTDI